jgi:hypothetical protein
VSQFLTPGIHEATSTAIALGPETVTVPLITQSARKNHRPFLHPLRSPDGRHVLTEDEPEHHPWQHGLYIGLNDVNGFGFWTEGKKKGRTDSDGSFRPQPLAYPKTQIDGGVTWGVETLCLDPAAKPLLQQTERWTARFCENYYLIDLFWQLKALEAVKIGLYTYGGLFLRMPFEKDRMSLLTSAGAVTNAEAEGQPAKWIAVATQAEDDTAGIAIFSHPSNQPHPELWRVDNQYGIGPCPFRSAPVQIAPEATVSWRYRVAVFQGPPEAGWLEEQNERYAVMAKENIP